MVVRFSSRTQKISECFLSNVLNGALRYDRIAGYFSSSIFEVAGDVLESVSCQVRVVCNSEIDPRDLETARAAELAMKREWSSSIPEAKLIKERSGEPSRFERLYHFLKSGKMQVRVLPSEAFGLIHGKAGVITMADGRKTSFLGSVNETIMGWAVNYELLWEDDSDEAVAWVQREFDDLWTDPRARPLSQAVIEDIQRISKRVVFYDVGEWKNVADAAAAVIEEPVYRESIGLADHQKYFIRLAFDQHRSPHGARLVLADSVGLGKTVQLAMAAKLMALYGSKPILVVVPATLTRQWQTELLTLLNVPSAIWRQGRWIDEHGEEYPAMGAEGIRKCPRRIGIVSQGLVTSNSEALEYIKAGTYECVIVDEAHRARRKNLAMDRQDEKPDPNNLLAFLLHISKRTHSLLLATATPVQVNPIEAWDLLNALAQGSQNVLGNEHSVWRRLPSRAIALATGREPPPSDEGELWDLMRNPFPQDSESPKDIAPLRKGLGLKPDEAVAPGDRLDRLRGPDRSKLRRFGQNFVENHNPFIRHIVRRTREYLEAQTNEHGEPLLPKIEVELFGETEPIILPAYLKDAYRHAQDFCLLLRKRTKAAGFLETMLLRRVGSSIVAGHKTAIKILSRSLDPVIFEDGDEDADGSEIPSNTQARGIFQDLTDAEVEALRRFVASLEANKERDPKVTRVIEYLKGGPNGSTPWLPLGCIIFSQYYDTIWWLGEQLTKEFPDEIIGIYAGGARSGVLKDGKFIRSSRDEVKKLVTTRAMKLVLGTDAASEGLNLQTLATLINVDLPWNPTRLEQRKGRIQRIGQVRDTVFIYNMRYKDSVEDKVHSLLSTRLEAINALFGQIPDVLQSTWIQVALDEIDDAKKTINGVPEKHPFELKYSRVEHIDWESCAKVLDTKAKLEVLKRGW